MSELTGEPLKPQAAKELIRHILKNGRYSFSRHAVAEMAKEKPKIIQPECVSALKAGACEPGETENGSWRYRVHAGEIWVVVSFRSEEELVIVTAWRKKR